MSDKTKVPCGAILRELGVRIGAHPDTIKKAFLGQPIRGGVGERARRVVADYLEEQAALEQRLQPTG